MRGRRAETAQSEEGTMITAVTSVNEETTSKEGRKTKDEERTKS